MNIVPPERRAKEEALNMVPIKTVRPMRVPRVKQAHRIAGCTKSGNGRRKIFQEPSPVFLPLTGLSGWI
jgi:hypothetical protein